MEENQSNDTFGKSLRFSLFGASHAKEIGMRLSGIPANLIINMTEIQNDLNRRRPGRNSISTQRKEQDLFQSLSGFKNDTTTGDPIIITIQNEDVKSTDYSPFKTIPRPSHVDYPAMLRYGKSVDLRGSGRFSGRMTAPLVAAGSIAKQILRNQNIYIGAYTSQIGTVIDEQTYSVNQIQSSIEKNPVRTIQTEVAASMQKIVEAVRDEQDSIGGVITIQVEGFPPGLGDPWFNSLESNIASAMMAIPGTRGVEFGTGFQAASMKGSDHNDPYILHDGKISTKTNHCGGIVGGISLGTPIVFRVAVKPTASIGKQQKTLNMQTKELSELVIKGRHDPCIVPRLVVVLEAMTAIILLDQLLVSGVNLRDPNN